MTAQDKTGRLALFLISHFSFLIFFSTCGLAEYYYLPHVPDTYIESPFTTDAFITLPSISGDFYYVKKFTIFYRIYLSNAELESVTLNDMNTISRTLNEDLNYFDRTFIDVTSPIAPSASTFLNRSYYEIETDSTVLNTAAGAGEKRIQISFPGGQNAVLRDLSTNQEYFIYRNGSDEQLIPDKYFLYTQDLLIFNNQMGPGQDKLFNHDVIGAIDASYSTIYISMYIVTEGEADFQTLYSRPTHIGVFRLQ